MEKYGRQSLSHGMGEVISSLSTGAIDALDHSLGVFNDFNLHEIAPYVTLTNHASSPFPVICSLDWLNGR